MNWTRQFCLSAEIWLFPCDRICPIICFELEVTAFFDIVNVSFLSRFFGSRPSRVQSWFDPACVSYLYCCYMISCKMSTSFESSLLSPLNLLLSLVGCKVMFNGSKLDWFKVLFLRSYKSLCNVVVPAFWETLGLLFWRTVSIFSLRFACLIFYRCALSRAFRSFEWSCWLIRPLSLSKFAV